MSGSIGIQYPTKELTYLLSGPAPQILDWGGGAACPEKGPLAEGALFM